MRNLQAALLALILSCTLVARASAGEANLRLAQGLMAGEAAETSVILQARLTKTDQLVEGDVPGAAGIARFEYATTEDFQPSRFTSWLSATEANDFIAKAKVTDLIPETKYFYRLNYGEDVESWKTSPTCSFKTLGGESGASDASFVVVTGMNYVAFHHGRLKQGQRASETAYQGSDKPLGYPALATIARMKPDFFVGTGDNVYYDSHDEMEATTIHGMRRKWHEQLSQPRFLDLFRHVPTYWEKDDHDHRYNDCDRTGDRAPSSQLGIRVFREQTPVVDPGDPASKTYRTHRINSHLQIWLVEGRDYRSPNKMEDGPDKTLWGSEQLDWLKSTLLASTATHKILISPTPLVGPDDAYKIDNHTNPRGFRHEGRAFLDWIQENKLGERGFAVICGDRHWQYHSIDPSGVEEFSSGALCDANARIGRQPGDPESTDPEARIRQLYTQDEASGGFLRVAVTKDGLARFQFFDEAGELLYQITKSGGDELTVLDAEAPTLLRDHLIRRIHQQYDERRADVAQALRSREQFEQRQAQLRKSLQRIVGELPEKTPLKAQTTGVLEEPGYRIEKVIYQSRPQHYVTANFYIPTVGTPPYPGVLIACGHSSQGKAYESYQRVGALMATNGLAALVYDPFGQGERRMFSVGSTNAGLQHKLANVNSMLVGRTAVGYQAWDGLRSIDYLLSREEVDATLPIGMTGNSGGGAQTMYLMALDDRIGPAAPSCHITTLERNFELGSAGDGCQSAPMTGAEGIDHPDFFAMRAPKPSIILAAEQDFKDIRFTRKTYQEAKRVFRLLDAPDRIEMFVYNDGHAFSEPRREEAVRWMRRWLLDDPGPISEPSLSVQPIESLQVTTTGQVLQEFDDAATISDLNLSRARRLAADRAKFWASSDRASALAEIRRIVGIRDDLPPPHVLSKGAIDRDEYNIEKIVLERADELPIPALLFRPSNAAKRNPATLLIDGRGKSADIGWIEERLSEGHVVLSVDLRGFGETADPPSKIVYGQGDHRVAMWSLHIGQSLLGQRVEESMAALTFLRNLPDVDGGQVDLVGYGRAGPVALHAAILDPRIANVKLRRSIRSWVDDVVARPTEFEAISHVAPGVLEKYDLRDLARQLGDKLSYE